MVELKKNVWFNYRLSTNVWGKWMSRLKVYFGSQFRNASLTCFPSGSISKVLKKSTSKANRYCLLSLLTFGHLLLWWHILLGSIILSIIHLSKYNEIYHRRFLESYMFWHMFALSFSILSTPTVFFFSFLFKTKLFTYKHHSAAY